MAARSYSSAPGVRGSATIFGGGAPSRSYGSNVGASQPSYGGASASGLASNFYTSSSSHGASSRSRPLPTDDRAPLAASGSTAGSAMRSATSMLPGGSGSYGASAGAVGGGTPLAPRYTSSSVTPSMRRPSLASSGGLYGTLASGVTSSRRQHGTAAEDSASISSGSPALPLASSDAPLRSFDRAPSRGGGGGGTDNVERDVDSWRSPGTYGGRAATSSSLGLGQSPSAAASSMSSSSTALPQAPPSGFRNLGNTCYMNAALQCILHGSGSFMAQLARTPVLHAMDATPPRSRFASSTGSAIPLSQALVALTDSSGSSSALLNVKSGVSRINHEFMGARQNDGHEFIRELLFGIHKEINRVQGKPKYIEMKDIPGESDGDAAQRWINYARTHDDSLVYDHFGGFQRSVSKCPSCNHRSLAFDPFLDLSVQVTTDIITALSNINSTETVQILRCERCKEKSLNGQRQTVVVQWPKTLVVHLKRFSANGIKDQHAVQVPKHITRGDVADAGVVMPRGTDLPPRGYTLSGVVLHHGSMGFGHYTAVVRKGSHWFECDDSSITRINESTALRAAVSAYIVFYTSED